jgi:general secretion pathway protein F
MPVFEYKGVNQAGKAVKGVADADNPRALRESLRVKGIFPSEIRESSDGGPGAPKKAGGVRRGRRWLGGRVKVSELAEITRQLATLLKAAIPIVDVLGAVSKQTENPKLQLIMAEVRRAVTEGKSLALAMGEHPAVFSSLYVNMVKAGETSGNLDLVFNRLADLTENQAKLKSRLVGTMIYPIIMMVVGTGIIMLLMLFVVPKLTEMFAEMGGQLPPLTVGMIAISEFLQKWWWAVLGGIVGWSAWFTRWKRTVKGKARWDGMVLKMPLFGSLTRLVAVARFSRTLGTLLTSGVPIVAALDIVRHVVGNETLSAVVEESRIAVQEGKSLAQPLEKSGEFPAMMVHMVAVGEQSGSLEDMLSNVASAYEVQVDSRITTMTALLEPVMILSMGVVVALIVFAVLMPMLQMNELLKG